MQTYYPHGAYASNVIEIADPPFSTLPPPTSTGMLAAHNAEPPFSAEAIYKKRKIERACDACRRRKTKCDGPRMPDNICTNCIQNRKTCSYMEASKPRGPPKAYVTNLEDRLERMEALLRRLRPEADFSEELGSSVIRDSWKTDPDHPHVSPHEKSVSPSGSSKAKGSPSRSLPSNAHSPSDTTNHSARNPALNRRLTPRSDTDSSTDDRTSSDIEEVGELSLSRGMKRLTVRGLEPTQYTLPLADSQVRFHGKSSCFKLIEPTRKLRDEHVYRLTGGEERSRSKRDSESPINVAALRRPEFWTTPSWELAFEGLQERSQNLARSLTEDLPPNDLADSLITLFFEHINPFAPIFHRPTFERQWRQGLQHKDAWFACLCLSVFAVASRLSNDPRVLDDGRYSIPRAGSPNEEYEWQRAGWRFFNAAVNVHRDSTSLFNPAGLFEVQTMALFGMFLRGTAFHPVAWLFLSTGLRKAQDVGAHRKKIYGDRPTVEGELWKRAFWVLVFHDRMASAALGRPCCSGEEEFDAELPLEVDDEYWETEDPEKAFQQPPGKPARISGFNSSLRLTKIVAYALRTIYVIDRSKLLVTAARPRWHEVLAQLNQAMTEWVESIPEHLRWSPHIEDPLYSNQSATLYITYYLIQIIIYRPFLPPSFHSVTNITPRRNMPIPCIAVCVNAGKCISRILKAQLNRGFSHIPCLILSSHVCAAILLMHFWDLKWQERDQMRSESYEDVKSPLALAMAELLEEISVFIKALETVQPRWRVAELHLNDLSSSLPQCLGGIEPSNPENDPLSRCYPPGLDDKAYYSTAPPDYAVLGDYRHSPPEYGNTPSPTGTTTYDTQVASSESSPHLFDFPHLTQYPLSGVLPLPPDPSLAMQKPTLLSERRYDGILSRPASLFDERAMDEASAMQRDLSIPSQFTLPGRTSYGLPASLLTNQSDMNSLIANQTKSSWPTDWTFNPAHANRASSDDLFNFRDGKTRNPEDPLLPLPERYI